MGWSGGTDVAIELIGLCERYVPLPNRRDAIKKVFDILETHDWDCIGDLINHKSKLVRDIVKESYER